MASDEVRIETADGAQFGVSSAARAAELYPGCVVVSYLDGREFDGVSAGKSRRSRGAVSGRAIAGVGRDVAGSVAGDEMPPPGAAAPPSPVATGEGREKQ